MQGKIKKVLSNRGYGFIDREGSDDDLFFHKSNLEGTDIFSLKEEMSVEFEVSDGRRGPEAINIKLVTGEAEAVEEPSDEAEEVEEPSDEAEEVEEPSDESDD